MRIEVVARPGIEVTEAIRAHATEKGSKLPKYYDGTQMATYTLTKSDRPHFFTAELVVDVEKAPAFVSHAESEDLYQAIDQVTQKCVRQLTDFKEKLKVDKHHAR